MNIVVIGGTGHIGTFLIPRLVDMGFNVTVLSRGSRDPYLSHRAWNRVKRIEIDRPESDRRGEFGEFVASLDPDIVIDLICFTKESAQQLVEAIGKRVQHLLTCCSVWAFGRVDSYPTTEYDKRNPICEYGKNKFLIEQYLLREARVNKVPATVIHPGHIVGPGWPPLNPQGNFNTDVWKTIRDGEKLLIPNHGMETVHHVHADDVASVFINAILNWSAAVGESFFALSPQAISLRGYAEYMYRYYGKEPNIEYKPWEDFSQSVSKEDARFTYDHINKSPCGSIEKAKRLLEYAPRYSSLAAITEAVEVLITD